jgi:hypothetical protein
MTMSEAVELKSLLEQIIEGYSDIDGIHICHFPRGSEASSLQIKVHRFTSGGVPDEYTTYSRVSVDTREGEKSYSYDIEFVDSTPKNVEGMSRTAVYIAESAVDLEALDLERGLHDLREKLMGICVKCNHRIHDPHRHYINCGKIKRW